jgi:hypothetical protein
MPHWLACQRKPPAPELALERSRPLATHPALLVLSLEPFRAHAPAHRPPRSGFLAAIAARRGTYARGGTAPDLSASVAPSRGATSRCILSCALCEGALGLGAEQGRCHARTSVAVLSECGRPCFTRAQGLMLAQCMRVRHDCPDSRRYALDGRRGAAGLASLEVLDVAEQEAARAVLRRAVQVGNL